MSTYSDSWEATPPKVRDFYRNYAQRHCVQSWKTVWDPIAGHFWPFFGAMWVFWATRGIDIAIGNWKNQLAVSGSFNTAIVLFDLTPTLPPPPIQPAHGPGLDGDLPDIYATVPLDPTNQYPRAKYNVRRTYWTGKPKRRRNL